MPERPDLEYVVPVLRDALRGARLAGFRAPAPVVLRLAVPGDPAAVLVGRAVEDVARRGPFVRLLLDGDVEIAVHPMLAGRFRVDDAAARAPGDLAVALALEDGRELRYRDDVSMGKFWVLPKGDLARVPGLADIGDDVLSEAFTRERFRALARKRRDQVKSFLLDHAALDTLGNAYADETLWAARLHPKARVRELSPEQLDTLHDAIVDTLTRARDEIARRKPPTDEKLRDFLNVRGRKGDPCPRCGTRIRTCGLNGHDAYFCPTCQPDVKGRGLVDWRKLGKA